MALSITELELQTTEYLPARDVMTSLPLLGNNSPTGLLDGVKPRSGGALGILGPGMFKNLAK